MPDRFHIPFMRRAFELAEQARGHTYPNPLVGAVLVRKGRILAEGYHRFFGGPHAEAEALGRFSSVPRGSTLYVTLEPCSTFGKTPPCTRLIYEKGVRHVVVAAADPNPSHQGRGLKELERRGVRVTRGVLGAEAHRQNEVFFKWARTGLPFVALKMAETLDGKIATVSGESRWITGNRARQWVHRLRATHQAVLVGPKTALRDNPRLHVNLHKAPQPVRIVIDPGLKVPFRSNLLRSPDHKVLVATTKSSYRKHFPLYDRRGIGLLAVRASRGRLDLHDLLLKLARMNLISLLVEGGGETAADFLESKLVDKIYFFVAPKIVGGRTAKTAVEGNGIARLDRAVRIRSMRTVALGGDMLFEGYTDYDC